MRRAVAVLLAVAGGVMVSSCAKSESGVSASRNAIATVPEQTTTTNPYAVPDVIDAAYVNRVLAGLDAAMGDVVRMAMKKGALTKEAVERMKAIYTGPPLELQINLLIQDSAQGFAGLKPNMGNRKTVVTKMISNRPDCVFVKVSRDVSAVSDSPRPDLAEQYVGIQPLDAPDALKEYNETGWGVIYDGFEEDRTQPPDPCVES